MRKKQDMKGITKEDFNELVMQNIGLIENEDGFIIDEDRDYVISIMGKRLVLDENHPALVAGYAIMFDPAGNPSIMDKLFKYYIEKHDDESGIPTRVISYEPNAKNNRTSIELIKSDGTVYKSRPYYNDNVKSLDLILKLNSNIVVYDFNALDKLLFEEQQQQIIMREKLKKKKKMEKIAYYKKISRCY